VTVVGGTEFDPEYDARGHVSAAIKPGDERVWNTWKKPTDPIPRPPVKGASTGGISVIFAQPTWQVGLKAYGLDLSQFTMRGVPDVSAVASPSEPGLWIVTTNQIEKSNAGRGCGARYCFVGEGGTSASSPIWAGVSRLLAETLNTIRLGNINQRLYDMAAGKIPGLVDVSTKGENCPYAQCDMFSGYQVGPGYDLGTGLGSPDINALLADY
jgi:kumamolisin